MRYLAADDTDGARYLAADDADGVAISQVGSSLVPFCSLAARPKGLEGLVVLSL